MKNITKTLLIITSVFLFVTSVYAQEEAWKKLRAKSDALCMKGKFSKALEIAKEELKVAEETFGTNDIKVASTLNHLAEIYRVEEKYAEAEPLYKQALAIYKKASGADETEKGTILANLAWLYKAQNKYAEAEPLYKEALSIFEKARLETTGNTTAPIMAIAQINLGEIYTSQSRYSEAGSLYKQALGIFKKSLGQNHIRVALTLKNIAELYKKTGREEEAQKLEEESTKIAFAAFN